MKIDMKKLIPPPERESFEREIANLFKNGDLSDLARLLQKDLSIVSRSFSPFTDDKHNPIYQFVLHLWAFDAIREGLAGEVLNIVLREREKWQRPVTTIRSAAKLTGSLVREVGEMIEAEIAGKNYDKQIDEIMDVINAAEEKKQDVITKRNAEYFGEAA